MFVDERKGPVCQFGQFARGTGATLGLTVRTTKRVKRACVNARRVILKLLQRNANITTIILTTQNIATMTCTGTVLTTRSSNMPIPLSPRSLAPQNGTTVRLTLASTTLSNRQCTNARRVLTTVLQSSADITMQLLAHLNKQPVSLLNSLGQTIAPPATPSVNHKRAKENNHAPLLRRCKQSLAHVTQTKQLSPIVKQRARLRQILRVLYHHAGGGPYLVKRPKIKGATIIRNLTRHVTTSRIPRVLQKGQLIALSLANVITNAGCHNSFRRQMGGTIIRIRGTKSILLFVSRLRGLVNANTTRKTISTTGVLGPILTQKRLRLVKTAALARCHQRVRGSTTLRHHFRPIAIKRPATRRAVTVLQKLQSGCRTRRHVGVDSRTLSTTITLSGQCVPSHFLPSGTVSLVSRTTSHLQLAARTTPSSIGRLRDRTTQLSTRGQTTVRRRSFRLTTHLQSRRHHLNNRLRHDQRS